MDSLVIPYPVKPPHPNPTVTPAKKTKEKEKQEKKGREGGKNKEGQCPGAQGGHAAQPLELLEDSRSSVPTPGS